MWEVLKISEVQWNVLNKVFSCGGGRRGFPFAGGEKTKIATQQLRVHLEINGQLRNSLKTARCLLPRLWIKTFVKCSQRKVNGKLCGPHVPRKNWGYFWRGTFFSVQTEWGLDPFYICCCIFGLIFLWILKRKFYLARRNWIVFLPRLSFIPS